jgi:hypothetical protein
LTKQAQELAISGALSVHRSKAPRSPARPGGPERTRETLRKIDYDFLAIRILFFLKFLFSSKRHLLTKRLKLWRFALKSDWLR